MDHKTVIPKKHLFDKTELFGHPSTSKRCFFMAKEQNLAHTNRLCRHHIAFHSMGTTARETAFVRNIRFLRGTQCPTLAEGKPVLRETLFGHSEADRKASSLLKERGNHQKLGMGIGRLRLYIHREAPRRCVTGTFQLCRGFWSGRRPFRRGARNCVLCGGYS